MAEPIDIDKALKLCEAATEGPYAVVQTGPDQVAITSPSLARLREAVRVAGEFELRLAQILTNDPTVQRLSDEHLAWEGA